MWKSGKSSVVLRKWFENEDTYVRQQQSNYHSNYSKPPPVTYVVDAVLEAVSNNPSCSQLEFVNGKFISTQIDKEITLDHDITCTVKEVLRNADLVQQLTIEVSSAVKPSVELSRWLTDSHARYMERRENELGDGLMFFTQANHQNRFHDPRGPPSSLHPNTVKQMALANADKQLTFAKSVFFSNKSFDNLYGRNMRRIEARVDHFLNNKKWYDDRGIPYQLTIMLSGSPGRGKSAVVRAIANKTGRHIVNVAFHSIQTATQLKNLTYSPYLDVYTDDEQTQIRKYRVPLDKRITVFDEVDANGDLLRDRAGAERIASDVAYDELTLGDVLQAFEGSVEVPGCIRIVNTNYPEVLDKAFTRPGRIDLNIEFNDDDDNEIAQLMYEKFFDRPMPDEWKEALGMVKMSISPVEISEVYFKHFGEQNDQIIVEALLDANERISKEQERISNERERTKKVELPHSQEPRTTQTRPMAFRPGFRLGE